MSRTYRVQDHKGTLGKDGPGMGWAEASKPYVRAEQRAQRRQAEALALREGWEDAEPEDAYLDRFSLADWLMGIPQGLTTSPAGPGEQAAWEQYQAAQRDAERFVVNVCLGLGAHSTRHSSGA
jgi:hypothetical protein